MKVTPAMQTEKRTSMRKTMKRGRKAKRGKKGKKGKGTLARKGSRRGVLKAVKPKSPKSSEVEPVEPVEEPPASAGTASTIEPARRKVCKPKAAGRNAKEAVSKSKPKAKAKASTRKPAAPASNKALSKSKTKKLTVHQERVGHGRSWRYEILVGQQFGCTNCRYIYHGCKSCRKSTFRGKTAAQLRAEVEGAVAPVSNDAPEVVEASSSSKKRKRSK